MNRQKIFLTILTITILGVCIFFFFHTPNIKCSILLDPSGNPSEVCDAEERQSPYQKTYLKMHNYFYPDETCMVSIETGDVSCGEFSSLLPSCNQSATTTPCSSFAPQTTPPQQNTQPHAIVWKTYTSKELGFSFEYPDDGTPDVISENNYPGETGRVFHIFVKFPSGNSLYGMATSKDYSAAKDGPGFNTKGFTMINDQYRPIYHGITSQEPLTPDEEWKTSNGSPALVFYEQFFEEPGMYDSLPLNVMVNLPASDGLFTGIGFVLRKNEQIDYREPYPAEDLAIFKKVITSIRFEN